VWFIGVATIASSAAGPECKTSVYFYRSSSSPITDRAAWHIQTRTPPSARIGHQLQSVLLQHARCTAPFRHSLGSNARMGGVSGGTAGTLPPVPGHSTAATLATEQMQMKRRHIVVQQRQLDPSRPEPNKRPASAPEIALNFQTFPIVHLDLHMLSPTTMRPTDCLRPPGVARSRNVRDPRLWVHMLFCRPTKSLIPSSKFQVPALCTYTEYEVVRFQVPSSKFPALARAMYSHTTPSNNSLSLCVY
jgi:hypothetical protein